MTLTGEEYEYLDKMIDEEPTIEELLSRAGMTETDALAAAEQYRRRYRELLCVNGLSELRKPLLWVEFIKGCKKEMTSERYELLLFLLAGGSLLTAEYDSGEELVRAWVETNERQSKLAQRLKVRWEKAAEFAALRKRLSKAVQPKNYPRDGECSAAFGLLCRDEYAPMGADLSILSDNVTCVDRIISAADLGAAAPLVYFRLYSKNRRKLYEKADYMPTVKTLLGHENYEIDRDNGKNFNQYAMYIRLYLELKECFPDADHALCDAGFTACSNLADWCRKNIELTYDMPITDKALVEQYSPMCFENTWEDNRFWHDESVTVEQLWKWQDKMTAVRSWAIKAAKIISFDELESFAAAPAVFLEKLFGLSGIGTRIRPEQFEAARSLLMREIETEFDELLVMELTKLIGK